MRWTRSAVTAVAPGWAEQMRTAAARGGSMGASSRAGRWWKAAATMQRGTRAWTWPATDPRGGTNGSKSSPTLASALAIEMTTLPSNESQTETAVDAAASHGVATTTMSHAAAI